MNMFIKKLLTKQSKRYKSNYEKHEKYKQLYNEAVTNFEAAKIKRQRLLTDLTQLEQDPSKVKETIGLYDRVIIPELKKGVKEAENQMFKHGTINWYDPDFILFFCVAFMISIPLIGYEKIVGSVVSALLCTMLMSLWFIYRRVIRRMVFK